MLQPVEDEIQAVPVLVAVVVSRLQHVLDGQLPEVWVLVGWQAGEDRLGHIGCLFGGLEGKRRLLQGEAVDVAVQYRERMSRHRHGEAGAAQDGEYPVV